MRYLLLLAAVALAACSNKSDLSSSVQIQDHASSKIVNGTAIENGNIAGHIVAVYGEFDKAHYSICTGTILDESTIVTAAHCLTGFKAAQIKVIFHPHAGDQYYWYSIGREMPSVHSVDAIYPHPGFAYVLGQAVFNDVGVIKFSGGLPRGYSPVKILPDFQKLSYGTKVFVAGYGASTYKNTTDYGVLREGYAFVQNWKDNGITVVLNQTDKHGLCAGDSGGPSFLELNGETYYWGINSAVYPANRGDDDCLGYSEVTTVQSYLDFIKNVH